MRFRSSLPLMFRHFLLVSCIALMVVMLAAVFLFGIEDATRLAAVAATVFLLCGLYVAFTGFVAVEVTDRAVTVTAPRREPVVLERGRYQFSSLVETNSINLIPVQTTRTLRAFNDDELVEAPLTNLSKGSFDRLMAELRSAQARAEASAEKMERISFPVPKEAMLADFRRLIKILVIGAVVLGGGAVVFISHKAAAMHGDRGSHLALTLTAGLALMFVMFAVPVAMEYRKRRNRLPAVVTLDRDSLSLDDDRYPYAELRRIVATPPEYGQTDWANMRKLAVESDRGRKVYHFGIRKAGGAWKTEFLEYGMLCAALEKAAAAGGFEFVFDL